MADCSLCPQFLKLHYKTWAILFVLGCNTLGTGFGIWKENQIYSVAVQTAQKLEDHLLVRGELNAGLDSNKHARVLSRLEKDLEGDRRMQLRDTEVSCGSVY